MQKVSLNGKEITRLYLTHSELMQGGELVFEMGNEPNINRGLDEDDKPYSMSE